MSDILTDLTELVESLNIPVETGVFSDTAPDEYVVITPMTDILELFADNRPHAETQSARLSLFIKNNYIKTKNLLTNTLLQHGFTITERRYIGREDETSYHHYAVDVENYYIMERID